MSRREVRFIDVATRLIVVDVSFYDPGLNVYATQVQRRDYWRSCAGFSVQAGFTVASLTKAREAYR